jgi:hypothetical protein
MQIFSKNQNSFNGSYKLGKTHLLVMYRVHQMQLKSRQWILLIKCHVIVKPRQSN